MTDEGNESNTSTDINKQLVNKVNNKQQVCCDTPYINNNNTNIKITKRLIQKHI